MEVRWLRNNVAGGMTGKIFYAQSSASRLLSTLAHVVSFDLSCPGYVPKGNRFLLWQSESQGLKRFSEVATLLAAEECAW
jgi:hypothetical protein